jgi:hypothetical protein
MVLLFLDGLQVLGLAAHAAPAGRLTRRRARAAAAAARARRRRSHGE